MPNVTEAQVFLVNLDTTEKLPIMFIPQEGLNWGAKSNWAVIPTVGRNNPFYHYTGGEDVLKFQLDWYAGDKGRVSAINAANKVKAWSRNNGYESRPPRVALIWGDLFQSHTFVIQSAEYTMEMFDRTHKMMPVQIYQEISLAKITDDNETHEEISDQFNAQEFESLLRQYFDPKIGKWFIESKSSQSINR